MKKKKNKLVFFGEIFFLLFHFYISQNSFAAVLSNKPLELFQQRNYSIEDGLPQNSIFSIAQTPDGFIWAATNAGIVRFDGITFDVFNCDNTPGMSDDISYCLLVDRKGTLWIGTQKGGILIYDKGQIENAYRKEDGLLSDEIRCLKEFQDGAVWVGTVKGINRIHQGKVSAFPYPEGIISKWAEAVAEDFNGQIWCGTSVGLLKLTQRESGYEWTRVGFDNGQITTIAFNGSGETWVGTNGDGIFRFKGSNMSTYSIIDGLSSKLIGIILFDSSGVPWIGTRNNGVYQILDNRISILNHRNGLSHDYISSIFEDREGNMWIGTNGGGLNILYDSRITSYNTKNGLSYDHVFGVFQDSHDCIWVGTFGGGVNCIKEKKIVKQLTVKDGLPSDFVVTIGEDHESNLWFGTYGHGVTRWNRQSNTMKTFTSRDGLISDLVFGIYIDRFDHLWVGTGDGGLHIFKDGKFILSRQLNGKMRVFLEDSRGNLWIGTDGFGLMRIQIRAGQDESEWPTDVFNLNNGLSSQDILAIFEDSTGVIWVGTFGGGLNRYIYEEGVFTHLKHKDGLINDVIFWILEDNNDNLWMSSMAGIFRVSLKELKNFFNPKGRGNRKIKGTIFDESSGMKVRECNGGSQPSGWRCKNGELLFITAVGLISIDTSATWTTPAPPPVSIKKVVIDEKVYSPLDNLIVPPGKGNIEIHYTGLSFRVPEHLRFKYKLEGYDEDWINPGTRREAYYTNIPHGTYNFRVQASNLEGVWNKTGSNLTITIQPHLLDIWWLKVAILFFALFLVRIFFLYKMKRIRLQQQELERQVNDRTRILKDKTLELEKVNNIVKSINTEVDPTEILVAILKETVILEGIERASALVFDKAQEAYTFKAVVGIELDPMKQINLSYEETRDRYQKNSNEIIENIHIVKNTSGRPGEEKLKSLGIPKSMLILVIPGEESQDIPAGYLILEDINNENAFDQQDIELLKNLKDHIASAFIKSKLLLELKSERTTAEEANQAKSMFLARMSHEIRTPMNSVIGFADMLMETPLNDEQKEYSQNITKCGEALLHLIDDILDFSKIETGELNLRFHDFDPEIMAYEVCRLMQPRLGKKPVEILCRIGDKLPPFVKSDPSRIRQVLMNLMGNAVKFTEKGEIELTMDITEETSDQLKLYVTVRDTGIGISPKQAEFIFEVFQQADGSITRKYGGTGLGLTISRQIATQLKGDIWVDSQPGQGSTFHFTTWLEKSNRKSTQPIDGQELENKKVLLVDDNINNLNILFHIAESKNMRPVKLKEGKKVISVLEEEFNTNDPFDLCVLDIQLPDLNGHNIAEQIRSHPNPNLNHLPLVGISTSTAKENGIAQPKGVDKFLLKPVQRNSLILLMSDLIKGNIAVTDDQSSNKDLTSKKNPKQLHQANNAKPPITILLAEDNLLNQKLVRFMMTKGGYGLEVVNNGKEAVETFSAHPEKFQLIFMDINMPEMDGREATRILREKGFAKIPIIAMTAHALKEDREKCIEAGMNDYIAKPIKRDIVFKIVNKWVLKSNGTS